MAKKKLLSESQVRRFMGLAGMKSNLVSNYLREGGMMYEEDINANLYNVVNNNDGNIDNIDVIVDK